MPSGLYSGIAAACVLAASLVALPQNPGQSPDRASKACIAVADAAQPSNADQPICLQAHIYDVVESADGTRFLDVCPPEVKDEQCRFTLLCPAANREEMGDLRKYRDQDVVVRGIVRSTHGRMGIVLSSLRHFHGGPEKFRPNPRLLRGFGSESNRRPIRDPNLVGSGSHRAFMNTREQEPLPSPQKH
jgi:hypothetical protein